MNLRRDTNGRSFPPYLLPCPLFLVFLLFPLSHLLSLGILSVPQSGTEPQGQSFPILGLLLQEGREVGADGMEVGPGSGIGIIGTLSYSGAPSKVMDISHE